MSYVSSPIGQQSGHLWPAYATRACALGNQRALLQTKRIDAAQYLYSAHPGYAPLANTHHFHPSNPGYTTTKAAVDHDTVG
eukprot:4677494-Pyramimonas_sp.AAC.1